MALVHSEGQDRWYFTKEELQRTPSVLAGIDAAKELSYRQQCANLIQDMGQRLQVSQLTINTAIVYMHRFYMFHSFSEMNRNAIAPCCLFLSAKLEEQPRKLEHVIKVGNACLKKTEKFDPKSETYLQQAQDLVINESILLQTLGFELTVDHPHTHVVRITQLVRASKDLAQTSYFMATNSLHLTPFCIQHKPSVVACVCIHLACKWSNWEFPRSSDNKDWWEYVDPTVTKQTLDTICQEFLTIIENCPNKLKRSISTVTIYKGGHRSKSAADKLGKNVPPTNGNATSSKGESSSKGDSSNGDLLSKGDHLRNRESSSSGIDNTMEQTNEQNSESRKSDTTLTITSSAAVVETPTSKVMLPPLQPLTTKYANMPGLSSNAHENKISSGHKTDAKSHVATGTKHKHREHDESSTPAKKLKTIHSGSSHGSQSKHPSSLSRPPSHSKHSSHHSSKPSSSHSTPSSLHSKLLMKTGASSQPHHSFSPKLPMKISSSHGSHAHHTSSPKLPVRTSSSHETSSGQTHHSSSSKRHSYPGHHATSNHSSLHHSSGNKMPTSHKQHSSPLDAKKSSGERHRRPSTSSSTKPKAEMAASGTPSSARTNDIDKVKKNAVGITEDFASPPGPQRFQKFPPQRPMNILEKSSSRHGPPLPSSEQATPPPPPLPATLPPPPPPPPT